MRTTARAVSADPCAQGTGAIDRSAQELARRLKCLADDLSALRLPCRLKGCRSPLGYVLDPESKEMLLPDGSIWRCDCVERAPASGDHRYDVRTQYARFTGARMLFRGRTFVFLGVVVGDYAFGFVEDLQCYPDHGSGLCAIYSGRHVLRLVSADEAFAGITRTGGR